MADNGTQSYQSYQVFLGGYLFTGFARGDSYSCVYDEDQFEKLVGNRGLGAWNKKFTLAATVSLDLLTVSGDNDFLMAAWKADYFRRRGFAMPFQVKDGLGTTVQSAEVMRVMKIPDENRGDSINTRVWTLSTTKMVSFLGGSLGPQIGNAEQAQILAAALSDGGRGASR